MLCELRCVIRSGSGLHELVKFFRKRPYCVHIYMILSSLQNICRTCLARILFQEAVMHSVLPTIDVEESTDFGDQSLVLLTDELFFGFNGGTCVYNAAQI